MQPDGGYSTARLPATIADLTDHFCGRFTLALVCLDADRRSRIAGWDVDERAVERLRLLAHILTERGFGGALVATNGSRDGKGKLVLFFRKPQPETALRALIASVLLEARKHASWGIERLGTVEARPCNGEGGLLRIGGRHAHRNGPLEQFFDPLTGEVLPLSHLCPAENLPLEPKPIAISKRQPFVGRWMNKGIDYGADGTAGVNRKLVRLAHEAYRRGESKAEFLSWVAIIAAKSPGLRLPSPKNGDPRNPLSPKAAAAVWKRVECDITYSRERSSM